MLPFFISYFQIEARDRFWVQVQEKIRVRVELISNRG